MSKRILVSGACGKMGREVVKTIITETTDSVVGAFDFKNVGKDIIKLIGIEGPRVIIRNDLEETINVTKPDVIIDFTSPRIIMDNIRIGLNNGINMIVGTTGITEIDLKEIEQLTLKNKVNALVVPNFAIGAVLMMQFAAAASKYFPAAEIVELHHDQKVDAPSGTALKTVELMNLKRKKNFKDKVAEIEKVTGVRGGKFKGINIHSVRLPGLVAHQEVILGTEGQSLTIRHDSYNRSSFMPGIKLALDKIDQISGLVYGLEKIME